MKKDNPCRECTDRTIGCHSICNKYKQWCKEHQQMKEEIRRRDPDNVRFGVKFILDALQKCGKLKNDNSSYIAGFQDAYEYGKGQGVMIEIEEV